MFADLDKWLFDSSGLAAHGFCLLWEPGLIWTYAISDTAIALAYFSIPLALIVIARQRQDLVFRPLLWLFAAFILLCGTTHWLDLITLWLPIYSLQGLVKGLTAIVSVFTAVALWRLMPKALVLPSPSQFREAHAALLASKEQLMQAQKMEAVGQLTGGIAHDFNNMLQAITGSLSMVERRIAQGRSGEVGRYLAAMRQASDNAASLTSRLLAFSRRQVLDSRRIEPDVLVRGMEELIRRTVGPEVRLDLQLGDGRWDVRCDPNQLESALLNLAINARDAMPNGGSLSIRTFDRIVREPSVGTQDIAPGNYVEIDVCDSGKGMSAETIERAFEPFFTTKPPGEGTGLGLSQVYGFVRQSGGVVQLDSSPGAGTTVRLWLPAHEKEPAGAKAAAPGAGVEPGIQPFRSARVLVVEDQDEVRRQIVEVLVEMSCIAVEAQDGLTGLSLLQEQRFDLIVTDIGLPGMNGRQLAEAARVLHPTVPILLVTGYAGNAMDTNDLAAGMQLLRKPFALDVLSARVQAMLRMSAAAV